MLTLFGTLALSALDARAAETIVRNDTAYDDSYDTDDQVAWLQYPECAASVFDPADYDLPLEINTVQVYLGSSNGNQDGEDTLVEVGLKILAEDETPSLGDWAWEMEGFQATVSSDRINEFSLVSEEDGLFALDWTEGWLAIIVCAPDPTTGYEWPYTSSRDTSGLIIETDSPTNGSYVYIDGGSGYEFYSLSSLSLHGSWIIRGVAGEGGGGTDTGGSSGGGSSGGGSSGGGSSGGGGTGGGDDTGQVTSDADLDLLTFTPDAAVEAEIVDLTAIGVGIDEGAILYIGGLAASQVQVHGDTAITGRSPSALPVGTHDVMIVNPDGTTDTLMGAFTVSAVQTEEKGRCGCATGGGGSVLAGMMGLVLISRRRRLV